MRSSRAPSKRAPACEARWLKPSEDRALSMQSARGQRRHLKVAQRGHTVHSDVTNVEKFVSKIALLEMQDDVS